MKIKLLFALVAVFLVAGVQANSPKISGYVVDHENLLEPLVGANVHWAGTQTGTSTDAKGIFR
jgi:hypothetical protein